MNSTRATGKVVGVYSLGCADKKVFFDENSSAHYDGWEDCRLAANLPKVGCSGYSENFARELFTNLTC